MFRINVNQLLSLIEIFKSNADKVSKYTINFLETYKDYFYTILQTQV